jgi:hypothetical protein
MILPAAECEFRLQEEIITAHQTAFDRRPKGFPDSRFVIMAPLVGSVDPAKTLLERQVDEAPGPVLLPCRAIQESGNAHAVDQ